MDPLSAEVRAALQPLVDDLRRGLREVPAGDMSPKLRKVVASSGGRLTPPLVRSLFEEIEAGAWVREKLAEALEPDEGTDLHRYLVRPDGWWLAFADAAAGAVEPVTVVDDSAARTIADLEAAQEEAKRRQATLRRENQALEERLKAQRREMKDRTTDEAAVGAIRAAEARARELEEALAAAEAARDELAGRVEVLRRRTQDKPAERSREESGAGLLAVGGLSDPVETARRLDLAIQALAAAARTGSPEPAAIAATEPAAVDRPRLPPGIAPDSVEGLLAVMALDGPVTLIVDGYNTTYHFDQAAAWSSPPARKRLNEGLRRLRRVTRADHRIVVVYDSTKAPTAPTVWDGQVEVRFTADATIADDAIVAMLAAGEVIAPVVVTDDRELRERAEAYGALTLWSRPLADWIATA